VWPHGLHARLINPGLAETHDESLAHSARTSPSGGQGRVAAAGSEADAVLEREALLALARRRALAAGAAQHSALALVDRHGRRRDAGRRDSDRRARARRHRGRSSCLDDARVRAANARADTHADLGSGRLGGARGRRERAANGAADGARVEGAGRAVVARRAVDAAAHEVRLGARRVCGGHGSQWARQCPARRRRYDGPGTVGQVVDEQQHRRAPCCAYLSARAKSC
jgi:hypothetical protein